MLNLIKIQDPRLRWTILSRFHPQSECYVVPDIKTKIAVEEFLLEKHGYLTGSPVFRIQEFRKEIFYLLESSWQLVPENFLKEVFTDFALSHKEVFIQNSAHSRNFFLYFYRFLPLLLHPEGLNLMEEWLCSRKSKPEAIWMRWWELSQEFFPIIKKKNIISEEGLNGIVLSELHSLPVSALPFEKVIFDLGVPSEKEELEFIKELSGKRPVDMIVPHFTKTNFYNILAGKTYLKETDFQKTEIFQEKNFSSISLDSICRVSQNRSETRLNEVKTVINQIHKWKAQGVLEDEMVLLAPDMEEYWFCLKPYLEREGISFKKGYSVPLIESEEILFWLSELRLYLNVFSFSDMETANFYTSPKKTFSEFYALFAKAPERELSKKFLNKKKIKRRDERMSGGEFIKWAVSFWPQKGELELLEQALEGFQELPLEEKLKMESWLHILESELFAPKRELRGESSQGISCLSLNAIHSIKENFVFILGLDQDSLYSSFNGSGEQDMEKLSLDLGFPLSFPHPRQRELNLLWFLQSASLKEVIFSFSDSDFLNKPQTPSLLWIFYKDLFPLTKATLHLHSSDLKTSIPQSENVSVQNGKQQRKPYQTNMDKTTVNPLKNKSKESSSFQDISLQNKESLKGSLKKQKKHFSALALKKYAECPFVYAVEYVFNFRRPEETDREMAPLSAGLLTHLLLEKLFEKEDFLNWKEESIDHLIESLKPKETKFIHNNQWSVIKNTLLKTALKFLEKEALLFQNFPELQIWGREVEWECFWNRELKDFALEGDILFKGRIDRLDYEPITQSYFIRDYKNSISQINHINSWIEKNELALLLYALIAEKGLIKGLPPGKVKVLDYYSYKDFSHKGYIEKGSPFEEIFGPLWKGKKKREVLETAFKNLKEEIHKTVSAIDEGKFQPKPSDEKNCERCYWRKWCRAPHLN